MLGQCRRNACIPIPYRRPSPQSIVPPLENLTRSATMPAACGRPSPAPTGASCTSCACWPTPNRPSLDIMLPFDCSATLGVGGHRAGRMRPARHLPNWPCANACLPLPCERGCVGGVCRGQHTPVTTMSSLTRATSASLSENSRPSPGLVMPSEAGTAPLDASIFP